MARLFLLFTAVPLLELYLLLWIGDRFGFWPTVGLVLLTGLLGATLAKAEGFRVLRSWRSALAEGRMPEEGVLSGLLVLVGGVLLITPGVLTDVAGLLLLFPPTRAWVRERVHRHIARGVREGTVHLVGFGPGFGRPASGPARRRGGGQTPPLRVVDADGEVLEPREPR